MLRLSGSAGNAAKVTTGWMSLDTREISKEISCFQKMKWKSKPKVPQQKVVAAWLLSSRK